MIIDKFSIAKDPLFNSTHICKVEDHWQQHRCDCLRTDRNLGMLGQNLKWQKGLQDTESVLSVVNFVAFFMLIRWPSILKSHAGRIRD